MRIKHIEIERFGGLEAFSFMPSSGLNVLVGANEAGKTTVAAFCSALFYGFPPQTRRVETNPRRHYMPWGQESMGGAIELVSDDVLWRLERTFGTKPEQDRMSLVRFDTGEEVDIGGQEPGYYFWQLSRDGFMNSALVLHGEGLEPSGGGADTGDVRARLENLSDTGDSSYAWRDIDLRLDEAIRQLETPSGTGLIAQRRARISELDSLLGRLTELQREQSTVRRRLTVIRQKQERLKPLLDGGTQPQAPADNKLRQLRDLKDERERDLARLRSKLADLERQAEEQRERPGAAGLFAFLTVLLVIVGIVLTLLPDSGLPALPVFIAGGISALLTLITGLLAQQAEESAQTGDVLAEQIREQEERLRDVAARIRGLEAEPHEIRPGTTLQEEESAALLYAELSREAGSLEARLEEMIGLPTENDLRSQLAAERRRLEGYERRLADLRSARILLGEAVDERHRQYLPRLTRQTSRLLNRLTAGVYQEAHFVKEQDTFSAARLSLEAREDGLPHEVAYFSAGTRDQAWLALRLASLQLLDPEGEIPLLMDEPLIEFDNSRLAGALDLLDDPYALSGRQIILLTNQERIPHMLRANKHGAAILRISADKQAVRQAGQ